MDFSAVAVQVLGVATSICLCFMGYVDRRGVQWISVATCVLGVAQAALLDQVAVLVMSAVNLLYYTVNLFDGRFAFLRSSSYRVGAVLVSLFAAAYTQYFALGQGFLSPATLAILGAATGLLMVISHNFWTLKTFTVMNALLWSAYCVLVGSYGNLIGNAFILVGVGVAVWKHSRESATENNAVLEGV